MAEPALGEAASIRGGHPNPGPLPATKGPEDPYLVQSLVRGLDLLRCFDRNHPSLTIPEITEQTGLNRTTAFRFLYTLRQCGLVDYEAETRRYCLGVGVLQLGFEYLNGLPLVERALPLLRALRDEVGESAHLGILDNSDGSVIYLARVPVERIVSATVSVGARLPAGNTSLGRALLAHLTPERLDRALRSVALETRTAHSPRTVEALRALLRQVRQQGYAITNQEYEEGVFSVAAPVLGDGGEVVAAVNVAGPTSRLVPETAPGRVVPAVLRTARLLSAALGGPQVAPSPT